MKNKIIGLIFSVLLISVFTVQLGFCKARWVKVGDSWRYELREGTGNYVTDKWRTISLDGVNEHVYYFDSHGNMVTGPVVIKSELYVYSGTGEAVTTGFDIDGVHYETDKKGKVLGLPQFYDLSRFYSVDQAIIAPTAPAEPQ